MRLLNGFQILLVKNFAPNQHLIATYQLTSPNYDSLQTTSYSITDHITDWYKSADVSSIDGILTSMKQLWVRTLH